MRIGHHVALFVAVNVALQVLNVFVGTSWWAFWPLLVWGTALGAHYMVYRARHADERWTKQRTDEVLAKSYDRAHIDDIGARHSEAEKAEKK